jgi:hypothetical protein
LLRVLRDDGMLSGCKTFDFVCCVVRNRGKEESLFWAGLNSECALLSLVPEILSHCPLMSCAFRVSKAVTMQLSKGIVVCKI